MSEWLCRHGRLKNGWCTHFSQLWAVALCFTSQSLPRSKLRRQCWCWCWCSYDVAYELTGSCCLRQHLLLLLLLLTATWALIWMQWKTAQHQPVIGTRTSMCSAIARRESVCKETTVRTASEEVLSLRVSYYCELCQISFYHAHQRPLKS